ncbi:hypothetical protein [Methylobacterium marchantiae]|uniref:Uncharacterized protein n=1 Tax=Methylobacterium marchantiae TaxID=600331 RepID=A0ABW3X0V6_9HYPH|nr:hypothetical protein AIGOOFII_3963 [Methylobacterium marchantiae]
MESYIIKFLKPVALSAICAVSVFYLTKSFSAAFVVSLVPLLLGWLGIMQGFAYGLATVAFLVSAAWAVTPPQVKLFLSEQAVQAAESLNQEMKTGK